MKKEDLLQVANDLWSVYTVRSKWFYNSWMYALAGEMLERKTGNSILELLQHVITGPLGLRDTSTDPGAFLATQIAKSYMNGDNSELFEPGGVIITSGSVMKTAGGIRSGIDDLLTWAITILKVSRKDDPQCLDYTGQPNLESIEDVFSAQMIMSLTSGFDKLYATGWAKVTTPSTFGKIGFIPGLVKRMPVIGSSSEPRLVYHHKGALPGFNDAIFMVPGLKLSFVVLTNSIGQGDVADWIGQLLPRPH